MGGSGLPGVSGLFFQGAAVTLVGVKKLSKAILIVLGGIVVLGLAAVFGVNLYIQSPGVQARIQEEISRTLRVPLKITNTSITPWSDLRITGISIPNGDTNLLEATAFTARYRLGPLFSGSLVIYEMSVESPKIVWQQNAEGKWELPKAEKAAAVSAENPPSTPEPQKIEEPKEPKKPKKSGMKVVIDGFVIKRGSVELLDQMAQPVATFSDVNMNFTTLTAERLVGTAEIGRVLWADRLALDKVASPFSYANGEIDLSELAATIGGGSVKGKFNFKSKAPKEPFTTSLKFDQVDLAKMNTEVGKPAEQMMGLLSGTLDLHGSGQEVVRAEGTSKLKLTDGRFRDFAYFEMIGQALQIRGLSDLRIREANADLRIADEKAFVESMLIQAGELQLSAKGLLRVDGKIQLESRLIADESLLKQLPSMVRKNFVADESGANYIEFSVTGKTDKPKTNLLEKIVGQRVDAQLDDLLTDLFGGMKKKKDEPKDDKKKAEEKKKNDDKKKAEEKKKNDSKEARNKVIEKQPGATELPLPAPAPAATPAPAPGSSPTSTAPPSAADAQ